MKQGGNNNAVLGRICSLLRMQSVLSRLASSIDIVLLPSSSLTPHAPTVGSCSTTGIHGAKANVN